MNKTYGYCRVSTPQQKIERQRANILSAYPDAILFEEAYTGTKVEGRKQFEKLLKVVTAGDTIVFDEVSRMSRNASEGIAIYEDLYSKGVNLVFIKEPHINTAVYDDATSNTVPMTGTDVDIILSAINEYMRKLRKQQITLAFNQAEKEVMYLRVRTSEGIKAVKRRNELIDAGVIEGEKKQIGGSAHRVPQKKAAALETIRKHSKTFGGSLDDDEVIKLAGVSRNTYYKYKAELKEEM